MWNGIIWIGRGFRLKQRHIVRHINTRAFVCEWCVCVCVYVYVGRVSVARPISSCSLYFSLSLFSFFLSFYTNKGSAREKYKYSQQKSTPFLLSSLNIKPTMAQDERTAYYAALCEQLYNPKSSTEGDQVLKILEYSFPTFADEAGGGIAASQRQPPPPGMENSPTFAIATPTDTASALRVLLENSPNPYVQTFCLSRLKQLVLAQFTLFTNETKVQLRKCIHPISLSRALSLIPFYRHIPTWILLYASRFATFCDLPTGRCLGITYTSWMAGCRGVSQRTKGYESVPSGICLDRCHDIVNLQRYSRHQWIIALLVCTFLQCSFKISIHPLRLEIRPSFVKLVCS